MLHVMLDAGSKNGTQVPLAKEEHPVQALTAHDAKPTAPRERRPGVSALPECVDRGATEGAAVYLCYREIVVVEVRVRVTAPANLTAGVADMGNGQYVCVSSTSGGTPL